MSERTTVLLRSYYCISCDIMSGIKKGVTTKCSVFNNCNPFWVCMLHSGQRIVFLACMWPLRGETNKRQRDPEGQLVDEPTTKKVHMEAKVVTVQRCPLKQCRRELRSLWSSHLYLTTSSKKSFKAVTSWMCWPA